MVINSLFHIGDFSVASTTDKVTSFRNITLIDNGKIVKSDDNTAKALNTFFSNIVSFLKIPDSVMHWRKIIRNSF